MDKTLLISHISDMDGLGNVILSKLVFPNTEVILITPETLDETVKYIIDSKKYEDYSRVFITDLGMEEKTASRINKSQIKNILLHFDHHESNVSINKNSWSTVVPILENGFKPSGTSLFYDYLLNTYKHNEFIKRTSLKELVEAIRSYDTYQFKETGNMLGYNITNILIETSRDFIIENFIDRIKNGDKDHFYLSEKESDISAAADKELEEYIKWCDEHLIKMKFLEFNIGLSISIKFRSCVGNRLSEKYKDELDFILIADYNRESFSIRTVNDINVGDVCKRLGGGGHEKAGGFSMTDENIALLNPYLDKNIIKQLKNSNI